MTIWRVQDVMTTEVITAPHDASVADIITLLTDRQITAVPITDSFDVVLGVVSWTDLRDKITIATPDGGPRTGWAQLWAAPPTEWPAGTAVEVMSGPALTIGSEASLPAAARLMYRRGVGRLLVVDRGNKLHGIVTRSDLLKVHGRLDAVIRDEVVHHVLRDPLMIQPGTVRTTVHDGVVTLAGRTARRTTAVAAVRLAEVVPGVADVVDRLTFDIDDTVTAVPAPRPTQRDPLRAWWGGGTDHRPVADVRQATRPLLAVGDRGRPATDR